MHVKVPARPQRLPYTLLLLIGLPFLVVVLGAGGVITSKYFQRNAAIAEEHTAYDAAEADLDRTAAFIQAKLGRPNDTLEHKYCGYTSNPDEFERGDLYCNVDVYLIYGVSDAKAGMVLKNRAENYLGNPESNNTPPDQDPESTLLPISLGGPSYDFRGLDCYRDYIYIRRDALGEYGYPLMKLTSDSQGVLINLDCGAREPKAAYYPIEQN